MNATPSRTTRRGLLGTLAAIASGAAAAVLLPLKRAHAARGGGVPAEDPGQHPRWGMSIDLDLCTGCGACVVACRSENNVALTGRAPEAKGTSIYWMDLLPRAEGPGHVDGESTQLMPTPCMHCDNPPCVKVCPVNATYQNEEGIVAQVWDRCIGCRYCQVACPYSRRFFNWKHNEMPEEYLNLLNPDVAPRPEGVVEKCTFCHHRIRQAREAARREDRPLVDEDVRKLPACGQSCPADAIVFGDLNDDESLVARLARSPRSSRLLEHIGTEPKVFYLAKDRQE